VERREATERAVVSRAWDWGGIGRALWRAVSWLRERWGRGGAARGARAELLQRLHMAANGVAREDVAASSAIGAAAAGAAQRMRGIRRDGTTRGAASTMRQAEQFVRANEGVLQGVKRLGPQEWDVVLEAFLIAKVNAPGAAATWTRPRQWKPCRPGVAGKEVGAMVAALERMGHVEGASWERLKAQREAQGGSDKVSIRKEAIFAWEVCDVGRTAVPRNIWERCGWALVVMAMIGAGRIGTATAIEMRHVRLTSNRDVVLVDVDAQAKGDRERVRRTAVRRPVVLEHWLVGRCVTPWLQEMRTRDTASSAYLFPSVIEGRWVRRRTGVGYQVDSHWVEPVNAWSSAAVCRAIDMAVEERRGRTAHCCRGGNNRELRRRPEVADVTRRVLHGRSVVNLIGSEDPYADAFVEDFREATRTLGR
jgi:hypothetical protein